MPGARNSENPTVGMISGSRACAYIRVDPEALQTVKPHVDVKGNLQTRGLGYKQDIYICSTHNT